MPSYVRYRTQLGGDGLLDERGQLGHAIAGPQHHLQFGPLRPGNQQPQAFCDESGAQVPVSSE